ncbi:MAG: DUF4388 domain-containing protein, partial [Myxococcota bacterium]
MAIHGSLNTMPLAELLSWVQATKRSGTATVDRDGAEWELRLESGRVVGYFGPEMWDDNLGHVVVTSAMLTEEDLRAAMQKGRVQDRSLMLVLVNEGFLSAAQLQEVLEELAAESLHDMFLDLPGQFVYSDASEQGLAFDLDDFSRFVSVDLGVNELLLEGARRQDEWEEMRQRYPTENIAVTVDATKMPNLETLRVRQRRIVASLAAGQSISDICIEMQAPMPSVLLGLSSLIKDGAITIEQRPEEAADREQNRINRLVEQSLLLRRSRQFDEAVSLLSAAVRMRPDAAHVRQALKEALEEQIRELYHSLPPHKVPRVVATDERMRRLKL